MNSFSFAGERSRPPTRSRRSASSSATRGRKGYNAGWGPYQQLRDRLGRPIAASRSRSWSVTARLPHAFPVTGRRALTSGGPAAAWRRWRCAFRAGPRSSPFPGVWGIITRCIARGANGHRRWHTAGVGECGCSTPHATADVADIIAPPPSGRLDCLPPSIGGSTPKNDDAKLIEPERGSWLSATTSG